jgi:DNA-binding winged helix-turn-helix (wHTH) protein/tetratricopeptide (TPR) repeat protein
MDSRAAVLTFGSFRLVVDKRELWKDDVLLKVRSLPLAMLTYLVQHPEQVITAEELRKAVWGGTRVGREAIRGCVRELRQVIGDEAATPRYVQTVGRQGYCFIGFRLSSSLTTSPSGASAQFLVSQGNTEPSPRLPSLTAPFVGRERELTQLRQWLAQAQHGRRQVVLVSGEPGIGKTTLIQQFVQGVTQPSTPAALWVGHGQCVEAYGSGEAYLPLLEALGRLGREPGSGQLTAVLHRHAPTWLAQLPTLVDPAARAELHRQVAGATQERMLRELCDALEVLTAEHPLLLVLEDLQWSDTATLAWLAAVARRPDPARLLVIGSYRPMEVILQTHPLRRVVQELRTHRLCQEVCLELWSADEVQDYVHQRFVSRTVAEELGRRLYERTEGNPLFLTASVEALVQQGVVGQEDGNWAVHGDLAVLEDALPEDLQQLITRQVEALSTAEQRLLEVASVSGVSFSTAEVAAGCQEEVDSIERRCVLLARQGQFLAEEGFEEWPDGTSTLRYGFRHALYQQAVSAQLSSGQKVRLHRLIGERREAGYGERGREIAGALALHFEKGRDYQRAVRYRQTAAEQALRRSAYHEAVVHCRHGLELLAALPDTSDRVQQELTLRMTLGPVLMATQGWAAAEVTQHYTCARALCEQLGNTAQLVAVLWGLWAFHLIRSELRTAQALAEECLQIAEQTADAGLLLEAHHALGSCSMWRGEFARARAAMEQGIALYQPQRHHALAAVYGGFDPGMACLSCAAEVLWLLGYPDQALRRSQEALRLAHELGHPFSLGYALFFTTWLHLFRGEGGVAQERTEAMIALASEHGFSLYWAQGTIQRGEALIAQGQWEEGVAEARQGLEALGGDLMRPHHLAMLAEGYGGAGQVEEGLAAIAEALRLVDKNDERLYEAEVYRIQGELILKSGVRSHKQSRVESSQSRVRG